VRTATVLRTPTECSYKSYTVRTYCTHTATALQAAGRELSCTCTRHELPRTDSARARVQGAENLAWPCDGETCCCTTRTTSDHECNNVYSIHCMHGVCCRYASSSSIKHTHIIFFDSRAGVRSIVGYVRNMRDFREGIGVRYICGHA
jgi:hypothetical protein